jgi:hypothetical protein
MADLFTRCDRHGVVACIRCLAVTATVTSRGGAPRPLAFRTEKRPDNAAEGEQIPTPCPHCGRPLPPSA